MELEAQQQLPGHITYDTPKIPTTWVPTSETKPCVPGGLGQILQRKLTSKSCIAKEKRKKEKREIKKLETDQKLKREEQRFYNWSLLQKPKLT